MGGLLETSFTMKWSELLDLIMDNCGDFLTNFITRVIHCKLQSTQSREKGMKLHGATATPTRELGKLLDSQEASIRGRSRSKVLLDLGQIRLGGFAGQQSVAASASLICRRLLLSPPLPLSIAQPELPHLDLRI
ncbi:hypothetical protein DY000_02025928 [Brassica cretica]|uniref:Uncharacterized protein n=1 Tax=Brassica cretica TaxID=69181 RepID=A0ABQ7EME3_BRACR|nr:hypothetical protein DY000_02025928 [Brassica cretica]